MTTLLSTPLSFMKTLVHHLWLSITSIKFYENVFNSYEGYGTKYILTLSFISSLICCVLFLEHVNQIRNYLTNNVISDRVVNIDHIIRQFPAINYDGQKISIQEETPLFLYNLNNYKLLAIDPSNKLLPSDRIRIPVILEASKIIINLMDSEGTVKNTFPIKYDQIFGNQSQILTEEVIKSSFAAIFDKAPSLFIYLIFPITTIMIFINALLEKSFIIIMVYLVTRLVTVKTSLKTCIRTVLFASGIFVLFQFIIILTVPNFSTALWITQTWANLLMILGILKTLGKNKFFSL